MKEFYVSSEKPLRKMDEASESYYLEMLDEVQRRIEKYSGWHLKFGDQEHVWHRLYVQAISDKWVILDEMAKQGYFNSGFQANLWYAGIGERPDTCGKCLYYRYDDILKNGLCNHRKSMFAHESDIACNGFLRKQDDVPSNRK